MARSELRFYKAAELLWNWRGTCIKQALLSVACRPEVVVVVLDEASSQFLYVAAGDGLLILLSELFFLF